MCLDFIENGYLLVPAKPLLIIVTGRPAAGKTTLSRILAKEIKCPLLSRDEIKEGYVNTFRNYYGSLPEGAAMDVYEVFFTTLELFLSNNISVVAEAAFQHKLWHPELTSLVNIADIRIIVCDIAPQLAIDRFLNRMKTDNDRERFHQDGKELLKPSEDSLLSSYKAPDIPLPTLKVDTTENYNPDIAAILKFIRQDQATSS